MTKYPSLDNFRHPEIIPQPLALDFVVSCYDVKSSTYSPICSLLNRQHIVFFQQDCQKNLRDLLQVCARYRERIDRFLQCEPVNLSAFSRFSVVKSKCCEGRRKQEFSTKKLSWSLKLPGSKVEVIQNFFIFARRVFCPK